MSTLAARVLDGVGPALRRRAGVLLADLVEALTSEGETGHALAQPAGRWGWATAFDLPTTPLPGWLGRATGTRVPAGLAVEEQRAYVTGRAINRRGTPAAIRAAAQSLLTGTRRVDLFERDTGPAHFAVRVYAAQAATIDEADVVAAVDEQKPVGLTFDAEIVSGATYDHMLDEHGPTYEAWADAFPTYDAATVGDPSAAKYHVPELGTEA